MNNFELLIIIEVPENKKVICQSEGCGRSVYKQVHLIRHNGDLKTYGSSCFKKHLGIHSEQSKTSPRFGGKDSTPLSDEEREMLLNNTEELIKKFEVKFQPVQEPQKPIQEEPKLESNTSKKSSEYNDHNDAYLKRLAFEQTKKRWRKELGKDADLPGWAGMIEAEAERLFKKLKNEA